MDSLKLIPSVFFDIIARVVPGFAGITLFFYFTDATWYKFLSSVLGPELVGKDSLLIATLLLFFVAYIGGQAIAPLAKLAQRLGEGKVFLKLSDLKLEEKEKGGYDYLRLYYPEAGAQCAKIRAEFTMFNGLFVVFLASTLYYILKFNLVTDAKSIILTIITLGMAARGRTTRDTFHSTVKKFLKATAYPKPPPPPER